MTVGDCHITFRLLLGAEQRRALASVVHSCNPPSFRRHFSFAARRSQKITVDGDKIVRTPYWCTCTLDCRLGSYPTPTRIQFSPSVSVNEWRVDALITDGVGGLSQDVVQAILIRAWRTLRLGVQLQFWVGFATRIIDDRHFNLPATETDALINLGSTLQVCSRARNNTSFVKPRSKQLHLKTQLHNLHTHTQDEPHGQFYSNESDTRFSAGAMVSSSQRSIPCSVSAALRCACSSRGSPCGPSSATAGTLRL